MTNKTMAEALQELAASDKGTSNIARLRSVFDEIEAALKVGKSRKAILETLAGQGLVMGMKSFESAIYRIRRERKSSQSAKENKRLIAQDQLEWELLFGVEKVPLGEMPLEF